MTSILVTVLMGFAVLGVQWRVYVLLRNRISDGDAALTNRASNNNVALWKVNDSVETLISALLNHDIRSASRHADTKQNVLEASTHFSDRADEFRDHAFALKVHAQELLDRSEAHAITPRQAVSR